MTQIKAIFLGAIVLFKALVTAIDYLRIFHMHCLISTKDVEEILSFSSICFHVPELTIFKSAEPEIMFVTRKHCRHTKCY